ncbi:S1 IF1 family protein, partial [mine drainage metagenome]
MAFNYRRKRPGEEVQYALKLPSSGEVIGRVIKSQGGSRFSVQCMDGKERMCSVPRRYKRRFW